MTLPFWTIDPAFVYMTKPEPVVTVAQGSKATDTSTADLLRELAIALAPDWRRQLKRRRRACNWR